MDSHTDAHPMNAETVAAVQFPLATPHGYYHVAVDSFVDQVAHAARDWESRLEHAQREAHQWALEADRLQAENQSLRAQISVFQVNGDPVVDAAGEYVTQSQAEADLEIERLHGIIADLQNRLAQATTPSPPSPVPEPPADSDDGPLSAAPQPYPDEPYPAAPEPAPVPQDAPSPQGWVPVPPPPARPGVVPR